MKIPRIIPTVSLIALTCAGGACAQEAPEVPPGVTYATYLYCDTNDEQRMDEYVAQFEKPIMDKLVEDGVMTRWGWMRHHTGGQWRRIRWFGANSVNEAVNALEAMNKAMQAAAGDANDGPGVCGRHEDYIWQVEAGTIGQDRGKAGISVYYSCKITDEERADEIVKEHFAPVFDGMVKDGKLTSWGWQSHVVGGWFRRLHTMTASDFESLLNARQYALDVVYEEGKESGAEFAEICGPHHDYLWEIVHESQ